MARPGPRSLLLASAALVTALGAGLAACGDDGDEGAQECRTMAPSEDGTTRLTIVAENIQFDVGCLRVEPGPVEITFDNRDGGTGHNLRVRGDGVDEATEIESGDTEQVLTVDLSAGRYTYVCDPHNNMKGTLEVVERADAGAASTTVAG